MEELCIEKPLLHIFVCINDRGEALEGEKPLKPSCGPKINLEDLKNLKRELKEKGFNKKVKITQTRCLGLCSSKGPIILLQPMQEYFIISSIKDIKTLIKEKTQLVI